MTAPDVLADPLPRAVTRSQMHGRTEPERSWTPVGTVDAGVLATVDGSGLVRMAGRTWSLDWWIGAEDRWHHPSREVSVRQRAVEASPVLETAVHVPGGDVVQRVYGVQASAGGWRGPAVVVEVENLTAVPVALALVVRPLVLDGPGRIGRVGSDGPVVTVDGRPGLLLARDPARYCVGRSGTVAGRLAAGEDQLDLDAVDDPAGDLEVAFVVPLAHTAVARVLLPVPGDHDDGGPAAPWDAPVAGAVASGWSVHGGDVVRVSVPEPGWDEAMAWAGRMLLLAGPDEVGACLDRTRVAPAGPPASVRAAEVAEALARVGGIDGLDAISGALAGAQRLGGEVRLGDRSDGTVALVHAIAPVLAGPFGAIRVEELVAPAAVAIRRLRKGRGTDHGLAASAVRGLRTLAPVLVAIGQPEVAEDALAAAAALGGSAEPRSAVTAPVGGAGAPVSTLEQARAVRDQLVGRAGAAELVALWDRHGMAGRSDATQDLGDDVGPVPSGGLGWDTAELAARLNAMVDLLVRDGTRGPQVLAAWPEQWMGAPVEAHHLATPWGSVSFALRWHGGRPALLWEVEPPPGLAADAAVPVLTAPGLDPDWEGVGWTGEALLAGTDDAAEGDPGPGDPGGAPDPAAAAGPSDPADPGDGAGNPAFGEGDSFT